MKMRLGAWCLLLGGALAVGPVHAQEGAKTVYVEPEEVEQKIATLTADLTGEAVPDGAGTAGATAKFSGEFDSGTGDVCFLLEAKGLKDLGEAHIHRGEPGRDGSVVIDLDGWTDGDICIAKQPKDINGILDDPVSHYVDIHLRSNKKTVAVRGQLVKQ